MFCLYSINFLFFQKTAPVGKILPEVKPIIKSLGPIGQKSSTGSIYSAPLKPMNPPPSSPQPPPASPPTHPPFGNPEMYNSAVTGHSWDPKTLTTPMSEDDWLPPLGPPPPHFSMWSDPDHSLTPTPVTPQTSPPSIWDSLPSFSIWSSPWHSDPLRPWPTQPTLDSSFYDSLLPPKRKDEEQQHS